ncbi:MAG: diacylglycerol kinase family lipid kinase [Desulfobacterales bacterium]|nr:diacylglycerol kinase family lipid kinase [Desulfobacterales bacterium]
MKIALVVNPYSGGKKTEKMLPRVKQSFRKRRIHADIFLSRFKNHVQGIARNLAVSAYDAIVAMGGDGTNFHLINGLLAVHPPEDLPSLGIIPTGSGNSFVKDLGIHSVDQAVEAVVRDTPRPVDVLKFTQDKQAFYFINLMGLGFVTDVAQTAERFKAVRDLSYLIGVAHRTLSLKFHHMELVIDGKPFSGKNCFVEFCNSRFTGGNMCMAPEARIDDGLMDIIIAGPMKKKRLISALPKLFTGDHLSMDEVSCIQAKKAEIQTTPAKVLLPDGEIFGRAPGMISVLNRKLNYLT